MLAVFAVAWMAVAPLNSDEVLAVVNGTPITRHDLQAALTDRARQEYDEAMDDLHDVEHAAVRDYVGRQAIAAQAQQQKTSVDAIYARALETDFDRLDPNMRNRIEQQRERIYNAERATLAEVIQKRLLEQAAKEKGMTVEQFNRALESDAPPVTKADLDFIMAYENAKQQVSATTPPGTQRLEAAIRDARVEQRKEAIIAAMQQKATVQMRIVAPRVQVSSAGAPTLGPANAPVHLIVFTDFECPYCKEAEQTLARLHDEYGDRLAITYRNYPLPNHLYARPAAIAAYCAAQQGRYFQLHDILFAHQNELKDADYDAWGAMAGVDRAKFDQCRASSAASAQIDADIREGVAAGVSGTPTFFVNGRLVRDTQGLRGVVAEEAAAR